MSKQTIFYLISTIVLSLIIFWLSRKILNKIFKKIALKTKTNFDDALINNNFPFYSSFLLPLFFIYSMSSFFIESYPEVLSFILKAIEIIFIVNIVFIVRSVLLTISDYSKNSTNFKNKPIDSYVQVFLIILWFIGIILIMSLLTGKNITTFLTTIGAFSAIILLIFKDTILGFVASIQITINDTVRIGDWITIKSSGADGDVVSISLSSVKVRNFDNTITTVPTYKLISDSFINWRGMSDSDGRRIKRSLLIKPSSIRFLKEDELMKLKKIGRISEYINIRQKQIEQFNSKHNYDKELLINGRNITNIGLFRKYTEMYLEKHPLINNKMMVMCRQLSPTSQGIPLEIYVFSKSKEWKKYEHLMSDIFDHLLASLDYFHLECFELSTNFPVLK
ncbi:MAG: mechanosensitive ion channel [Flavobacteriaceae bacterium]|nr:mechanosensitive ion channel [Flavobacteriaceae bacterium]